MSHLKEVATKYMQHDSFVEVFDTVELTVNRPANPLGELFTYYPSRRPDALHYHDFLELGYCERGSGVFIVDGDILPFSGKCASIIYENQRHIAMSTNEQKSLWHFLYIDVAKLFHGTDFPELELAKNYRHHNYDFPNLLDYSDHPDIYDLIRLILDETATFTEDKLHSLRGLVYALLLKHSRLMIPKPSSEKDRHLQDLEDIGPVLDYINVHYTENISIETLVALGNLSKSTLQRKFFAVTGFSPIQYLHNLRIKRASVMLLDDKKPIFQISMDIGYNSLSSFNRMFLSINGMSPSNWRKAHTEKQ